jgi:hypothetical protein
MPESIPVHVLIVLFHLSTAEVHFIGELEMRPVSTTQGWGPQPHSCYIFCEAFLLTGSAPSPHLSLCVLQSQRACYYLAWRCSRPNQ